MTSNFVLKESLFGIFIYRDIKIKAYKFLYICIFLLIYVIMEKIHLSFKYSEFHKLRILVILRYNLFLDNYSFN